MTNPVEPRSDITDLTARRHNRRQPADDPDPTPPYGIDLPP
jgi:hypothetical protein